MGTQILLIGILIFVNGNTNFVNGGTTEVEQTVIQQWPFVMRQQIL